MKSDESTSEQSELNEATSSETNHEAPSEESSLETVSPQEDDSSSVDEPELDESVSQPVSEPKPEQQKSSSVIPTLISLLALMLVGGGLAAGYHFWQQFDQEFKQMSSQISAGEKRQTDLQEKLSEGQRQLEAQTQQIEVQRQSLTTYQAKLERDQKALKQRGDDVQTIYAAVEKQLGAKTGHWRVAEAEHLMRTAQNSLALSHNIKAATTALKAADQRLRETNDPSWQGVRGQLSDEIGALSAVPQADIAGLSATLDSLIGSSDSLPLIGGNNTVEAPGKINLEHGAEATVTHLLTSIWEGLKSMIIVRYNDRPVEAMLPPDRRFFIMQNLRLKLQSTKVALLQKNATLYRSNLKQVIGWVDGHFEKDNESIKSFQSRLLELDAANISPKLPDISTSLRSLQDRIEINSRRGSAS
jgi:uroporphyrin-3 C-methyltransferase